jgi:uncharacterized protein YdaU (DUF1376 family)
MMPLWTDAYLGDTTHLTTLEHGAYLLLLMSMWRAGGMLPNDDKKLARFTRLGAQQWRRIKPTIMEFFTVDGDVIIQQRLHEEYIAVKQRSKVASNNARAKYKKTNNVGPADAVPDASQTPALHNHTHNQKDIFDSNESQISESSLRSERARDFDVFWDVYPNKVGKAAAKKAFEKATKRTDLPILMAGLDRYIHKTDDRPWCNPATWLNQDRWEDRPAMNGHNQPRMSRTELTRANLMRKFADDERAERQASDDPRYAGRLQLAGE